MAFFRAWESQRPPDRRLFADPFAPHFIRPSLKRAIRLSRVPIAGSLVDWYTDRRLPGARTSGIARTKFIDDALLGFLQANVQQIVILGA
ncbi:MAG TPA: class I SAM-dependent methyltransferase, partial [Candidatus Acidoferrum sp.]|nr:class I SAM-dependent methyltransferase [Candidatus Acidoferrum sp.]